MKASPTDQRLLLDVAELDARIRQSDHARRNPPQAARVQELVGLRQIQSQELSARLGVRDDVRAELTRAEADVEVVDARRRRDEDRLQTASNAKEAQGLESELTALARRKGDLEDRVLELMERLEVADAAVGEQERLIAATNDEGARLSADAKALVASETARHDEASRDRAAVAARVPSEVLAQYDRLAQRGGTGAALLRRQTCEGCRMMLSGTDLNTIRQASADDVVTCPECGCILVRTEESGL